MVGHHKGIIVRETLCFCCPNFQIFDSNQIQLEILVCLIFMTVVPLANIEKTDLESVAKLSLVCLNISVNISVFLFLWVLLQYHSLAVFTSCLVCLPTAGFFLYLHSKLQQLFVVCCYPQGSTKLTQRSIILLLASKDSETLDIRQNAMKRQGL